MTSQWPTSIDNFGHVTGGEPTNQPNDAGLTHSMIHNLLADAVTALETHVTSGGSTPTQLSFFPANPTGMTTVVETPDAVSGTNNATILVTPQNQMVLGIKLAGDAFPRWVLTSDSDDGLYLGDGITDAYSTFSANISYRGGTERQLGLIAGEIDLAASVNGVVIIGPSNTLRTPPALTIEQALQYTSRFSVFVSPDLTHNPNDQGDAWALRGGDLLVQTDEAGGIPSLWQASAAGNNNWVQIGSTTLIGTTDPFNAPFSGSHAGNTALGSNALGITNIGGAENSNQILATAIGYAALSNAIGSHSGNTAVGNAAANLYAGNFGTAIGVDALYSTVGDRNTGIGAGAGSSANGFTFTGSDNVSVGHQALHGALSQITTGSNNIAVGSQAMANSNGTSGDVAIGYQALQHDTGGSNVAVGYQALVANTTGANNVAIGYQSLSTETIGFDNVAIGYEAMLNATTSDSVAIGFQALQNDSGGSNVAVGEIALQANTSGSTNVAVGIEALALNITGSNNIAIGGGALTRSTTGSGSVAIGTSALNVITTATPNTAVGYQAGQYLTSGNQNTVMGYQAFQGTNLITLNNSGVQNVAIGYQAMQSTSRASGTSNVAVGYQALLANTTGGSNVALGYQALIANTTGQNNIAIGSTAGSAVTNANQTVIIGVGAGQHITNNGIFGPPDGDIAIGYQALQWDVSGVNVAIGYQAMQVAGQIQGGAAFNVAIGYQALAALTTGPNNVVIGASAGTAMTTTSSSVVIGNIAGKYLTTGDSNTFIGFGAGPESGFGTIGNAIAIGPATTDATSAIAIGQSAWVRANGIGIGVDTYVDTTSTYGIAIGGDENARTSVTGASAIAIGGGVVVNGNYALAIGSQASVTANGAIAIGASALAITGDVAIGYHALTGDTGGNNVAVGYLALTANLGGNLNAAVGFQALKANTTGVSNTAIGSDALFNTVTGSWNTALGSQALQNSTGNSNTAVGQLAGQNVSTGFSNVAVGVTAGPSVGTYNQTTTIGTSATAGGNNAIAIGCGTAANAAGAVCIGVDSTGGVASTGSPDSFILGTSKHTITAPGKVTGTRIQPRLVTVTQSATPATNTDTGDLFTINGLAQAVTSMTTSLTGTPADGEKIEFRISDNGSAKAITWGASFAATTVALPTTTVSGIRLRVSFEWDASSSVWVCIGVA